MGRESVEKLGELQRAVMEVVWDRGECSVHDVIERLRGREPAYTTILSVMQKLEKGGWLAHRQEGRTYIYRATSSREELGSRSIRQTIRQLFKGDIRSFMQQLIEDEQLSDEELLDLRRMIDKQRKK